MNWWERLHSEKLTTKGEQYIVCMPRVSPKGADNKGAKSN